MTTTPETCVEELRFAMLGDTDGDFIDPESDIPAGEMFRLASEYLTDSLFPRLSAAGLLVGAPTDRGCNEDE